MGYGARARLRNCSVAVLLSVSTVFATSALPARAEPLTLVALGDSLTQGYGLVQEEGLVPQLSGWLEGRGHDVVVINAGVSGDTTAGGLARVEWSLADGADALMVALGGNDLLRGLDPANSRANLEGILQAAQARDIPVLLVGMPAPGNYGPDFKAAFEAMYPELAAEYGALHFPNLLQPMSDKADAGVSFNDLMQDDRIHPNAEGVAAIVEGIGPMVEELLARAAAPAEG